MVGYDVMRSFSWCRTPTFSYYKSRFHDYISHRNHFLFSFLCQQVNNTMVRAIKAETCNSFSEFWV